MIDRRKSERIRQVFLPACVRVDTKRLVAVVRDLSEFGIGIHCEAVLEPGTAISIQWGSNPPIEGVVSWSKADRIGIITASSPLAHNDGERPRASRFDIGLRIQVHHHSRTNAGEMINLSTKGMSIRTLGSLGVGDLVTVCLGKYSFEECTIRWAREDTFGLSLKRAIRLEDLRNIVAMSEGPCRSAA